MDYVFVEYKFVGTDTGKGSSNLGKTRDGRQGSEGWIMGSNRIERAVGDKAVAKNIAEATKSGRYESWVIATRPNGSTFVEVLDAMGRPKPLETSRILKPDTNLLGAVP